MPLDLSGLAASVSSAHRNADNVFPEPVGAMTSVFSPSAIALHAPSWAGVGAGKAPLNHRRVGSVKRFRMGVERATPPLFRTGPTRWFVDDDLV